MVSRVITLAAILGALGSLGVWLGGPLIASLWAHPEIASVMQVCAIDLFLRTASVGPLACLQRYYLFKELAQIDLVAVIFGNGVVTIILGIALRDYWALAFGAIAASLVRLLMLYGVLRNRLRPNFRLTGTLRMLRFGAGMMVARSLNYLAINIDNIIVGHALGVNAMGLYTRAYNLMSQPSSFVSEVYERVIYPRCAALRNHPDKLDELYLRSIHILMWIVVPSAFLGVLLAKPLVMLLLGGNWIEVVAPLKVLLFGMIARVGYVVPLIFARVVGTSIVNVKAQAFYVAAVFVFAASLVQFGVLGVAWGVVASLFLCNVLFQVRYGVRRGISGWAVAKQYLRPCIVSLIGFFVAEYVISNLNLREVNGNATAAILSRLVVFLVVLFLATKAWMIKKGQTAWLKFFISA
jgi:PST family polysaccharide transporter